MVKKNGPNASINSKGSRDTETKEDIHHDYNVRLNCRIGGGGQLRRWITAPDRHQGQRLHTSPLVVVQPLYCAPVRLGVCCDVRQKGSGLEGTKQLHEHRPKDNHYRLPGNNVHNRHQRDVALLVC